MKIISSTDCLAMRANTRFVITTWNPPLEKATRTCDSMYAPIWLYPSKSYYDHVASINHEAGVVYINDVPFYYDRTSMSAMNNGNVRPVIDEEVKLWKKYFDKQCYDIALQFWNNKTNRFETELSTQAWGNETLDGAISYAADVYEFTNDIQQPIKLDAIVDETGKFVGKNATWQM